MGYGAGVRMEPVNNEDHSYITHPGEKMNFDVQKTCMNLDITHSYCFYESTS